MRAGREQRPIADEPPHMDAEKARRHLVAGWASPAWTSHAHPHWRNFALHSLRVRILAWPAKASASLWKLGIGRVSRLAGWGWRICRVTRAQKRCPHHSGQHAETGTHYGKFGHGRLLPVSRQASDAFDWQFWCPLSKL